MQLSKHGCCINGLPYGAFMHADDLILLTPTLTELQTMVNICQDELDAINLKINIKKSNCLRIGKRYMANCCTISTKIGIIPWVKEIKYLGLNVLSKPQFA